MNIDFWINLITTSCKIEKRDKKIISDFHRTLAKYYKFGNTKKNNFKILKKLLSSQGFGSIDIAKKHGGLGRPGVIQLLIDFICGYFDLDLRDVASTGHGKIIFQHGTTNQIKRWGGRILNGELVGIACTEIQGGSNIHNIKTVGTKKGKYWIVNGTKSWISRITEASIFIVIFKNAKTKQINIGVVDAKAEGLKREVEQPSGLGGWSWGKLYFNNLKIQGSDIIGDPDNGISVFSDHFAYYRRVVSMLSVGAVAHILDHTLERIQLKVKQGDIVTPRDTTLCLITEAFVKTQSLIFSCIASFSGAENKLLQNILSKGIKSYCVDTANNLVLRLSHVVGASSFVQGSYLAKVKRDLSAYYFADGIHEELLRSAGKSLLKI